MNITLTKGNMKAVIADTGAQLLSLSRGDREYIWNGDPSVWKYHAPILFPAVGRTKDGYYTWEGKKYELGTHGFIRDMTHTLTASTETSADWECTSTEETLRQYPWKFSFKTHYELTDTGLIFTTSVENRDTSAIPFQLGTHTAFMVDTDKIKNGSYSIELEKDDPLQQIQCDGGYLQCDADGTVPVTSPCLQQQGRFIPLTEQGFGAGLVLTGITSKWAAIHDKQEGTVIRIKTEQFPYMVLWTNEGDIRFICIEPWYGIPDREDTDHSWEHKASIEILEAGKTFSCDQSITIG